MTSSESREIHTDRKFYYVSAKDGDRTWLLAGPYPEHRTALDMEPEVRERAIAGRPAAVFYAFGTCGSDERFVTPLGAWTGGALPERLNTTPADSEPATSTSVKTTTKRRKNTP